jgi:mRNA interferase HicA
MKKRELEKMLRCIGWTFLAHGARHDIWTNAVHTIAVPRHREINEVTARGILRDARELNHGK